MSAARTPGLACPECGVPSPAHLVSCSAVAYRPPQSKGGNTHYAVVVFSGDPAAEHPDEDLHGHAPSLSLIACGSEEFCWRAVVDWTAKHPLRMWEDVEVLARDPARVERSVPA